jgi:formylglycine-generating enzyme required for sulfatase activity
MTPAYWGDPGAARGFANGGDLASRRSNRRDWEYAPWDDGYAKSAPVGTYRPNRFGLYDVLGNVHEWCRDEYFPSAYAAPIDGEGDRAIPDSTDYRQFVARGGAWDTDPRRLRIAWRLGFPELTEDRLGLRPARRLDP